jgi:hypothetical protein
MLTSSRSNLERELVSIEPKLVLTKRVSAISRNALSYALLVFILIALSLAYFHLLRRDDVG